jgi:hypothetical protein
MSEYTEYYVIPTPSIEAISERLKANRIRSAIYMDEAELEAWEALPEDRRFGVVYTLDATLERLGGLFTRALWLLVDEDPNRWRMDLWVDGSVARFLFSDRRWGDRWNDGDEELIVASRAPLPAQIALVEDFFAVPRTLFAQHLRMGGLKDFVKATGMPLHIPTDQGCLRWFLDEGWLDEKIVVPYDELD